MNQIRQVPSQGSAFSERWFEAQRAHPNVGRDRKDQDSEPEQGLHLLPVAWDCLGPRAPTLGRHRGQPACGSALWRVWHTLQAACGRESQWAQGTFQETQLGISECSVHSKSWLTPIPRNRFFPGCRSFVQNPLLQNGAHCTSSSDPAVAEGTRACSPPVISMQLSCLHLSSSSAWKPWAHHLLSFFLYICKLLTVVYGKNGGLRFTRMGVFKFRSFCPDLF